MQLQFKEINKYFKENNLKEVLNLLADFELKCYFESANKIFTNEENPCADSRDYGLEIVNSLDTILGESIMKIIIVGDKSRGFELEEIISYLDQDYSVSHYPDNRIELYMKDVSKGDSLKAIMDYENISPQDVVVFGNDLNDLSMFSIAKNTVAIKNSSSFIKMHAEHVGNDNNDSAIEEGLRHFSLID